MRLIHWETFKPFLGGISDGNDYIGLSNQNYYELKKIRRTEQLSGVYYRFSYHLLRMKKIGDIQTRLVPIIFPISFEEVRRSTTAQGIKFEFVQYADMDLFEGRAHIFTSGMSEFRIVQRKFYNDYEQEVLFQDIEDALIQYGYIHGLKKFQKLED